MPTPQDYLIEAYEQCVSQGWFVCNPGAGSFLAFRYDYCYVCAELEAAGSTHWHDPYSCLFNYPISDAAYWDVDEKVRPLTWSHP